MAVDLLVASTAAVRMYAEEKFLIGGYPEYAAYHAPAVGVIPFFFQGARPCLFASEMKPPTSRRKPLKDRSISINGSAIPGQCCFRTRKTSRRSAQPNWDTWRS